MAYLFTNEEDSLALLGDGLDQEVRPHVVHVGNQDGCVLWGSVYWVLVLGYLIHTIKVSSWRKHKSDTISSVSVCIINRTAARNIYHRLLGVSD